MAEYSLPEPQRDWYVALVRPFPFYFPKFHLFDLVGCGRVYAVRRIFTWFSYVEDLISDAFSIV